MADRPDAFNTDLSDDEIVAASLRVGQEPHVDVERLHRAILREPGDPQEGREPVPVWLWLISAIALFWGGWYLGRTGGSFDPGTHLAFQHDRRGAGRDATVSQAVDSMGRNAAADPLGRGRQLYSQHCQSCHQEDGRGLGNQFPPIVGSEWVTGPEEILLRILLDGLEGPVEVGGVTFDGRMPAWRNVLSDADIGAAATYIRQWPPNAAPAVEATTVAAIREATANRNKPWTARELRSVVQGEQTDADRAPPQEKK